MASSIEKQQYRVVRSFQDFEIRHYPPVMLASVYSQAKTYRDMATPGFRTLAGFIFGGNTANTRISMTAPVHMDINDSKSSMSFVMPSEYEHKDLPTPSNPNVILEKSREEYVAALSFGGYASDKRIRKFSGKLQDLLRKKGITFQGNFRYLGYNPPYQLIGRQNEIIVSIAWSE